MAKARSINSIESVHLAFTSLMTWKPAMRSEVKELRLSCVLGDFTGQPETPLPKLKERKFVEVTPDTSTAFWKG